MAPVDVVAEEVQPPQLQQMALQTIQLWMTSRQLPDVADADAAPQMQHRPQQRLRRVH